MTYQAIYTNIGLQLIGQAAAQGLQIQLTHMAVGDGAGNFIEPTEEQAQLTRELYRGSINKIYRDKDTANLFTAELIVPASIGGFTIREVGIFDKNGNLIIVGNVGATYKPLESEGTFSDVTIRIPFMATNADVVSLIIDPNVVVATQQWILNTVTPAMLVPGGTTGQILTKNSNADGDFKWDHPDTANIIVDVLEEPQTLAASQVNVILSTVTTRGLAVYVDGVRIPEGMGVDEWQPLPADPDTTVKLGKSYPEGTKILMVQNEPAGRVPFPLERYLNLSDVPDKALARQNLGVYSKEETASASLPAGSILYFAKSTTPTGFIKANGAAISRTVYADLFTVIGTTFGEGDGFNTFNVPDARGLFLRAWDDGRGHDQERAFGSYQADELKEHKHFVYPTGSPGTSTYGFDVDSPNGQNIKTFPRETSTTGGLETRPKNLAVLCCIKY